MEICDTCYQDAGCLSQHKTKNPARWRGCLGAAGVVSAGNHIDKLALAGTSLHKSDCAVGLCKQRVVPAAADIRAGMKMCAALPHQNVASHHCLAAKPLDAQPFRFRIAAVPGTAACLFVCHLVIPL